MAYNNQTLVSVQKRVQTDMRVSTVKVCEDSKTEYITGVGMILTDITTNTTLPLPWHGKSPAGDNL
jgi:hypothetical protein